ncbi:ATP-dependent protease La 2 [Peziza echinospora]|nr:ATP-dependent protease La 2 [Peziza echinospora]
MDPENPKALPIITLPYSTVLIPGAVVRLNIDDRKDIQALLAKITYESFKKNTINNTNTGTDGNASTDGAGNNAGQVENSTPSRDGQNNNNDSAITPPPGTPPVFIIGFLPMDPFKNAAPTIEDAERARSKEAMYRNIDPASASLEDLCEIGTVGRVVGVEPSATMRNELGEPKGASIIIEGLVRFRITNVSQKTPFLLAEVEKLPNEISDMSDVELNSLFSTFKTTATTLLHLLKRPPLPNHRGPVTAFPNVLARRLQEFIDYTPIHQAGRLVDFFVAAMDPSLDDRLSLLKTLNVTDRLRKGIEVLTARVENIKAVIGWRDNNSDAKSNESREIIIRGPLGPRRRPAGNPFGNGPRSDEEGDQELIDLISRLNKISALLPASSQKVIDREVKRLKRMTPQLPDYSVQRAYLETLAEIPWQVYTEDKLGEDSMRNARRTLDEDHYGLEQVKRRIVEYLAVLRLKAVVEEERILVAPPTDSTIAPPSTPTPIDAAAASTELPSSEDVIAKCPAAVPQSPPTQKVQTIARAPILLLAGPPGTGKTSLAKSIATALGRKFHRISLGGVHSEAEIRGHRRTYIAAMPGLIVNGLRKVGVANPVFLLDEIDKVGGRSNNGDPAAALLEVLDPEQNWSFQDHYLGIPVDLSRIIFICTANYIHEIPPALKDRMEPILLSAYTHLEKFHIASRYLVPKQVTANGLVAPTQVNLSDEVLRALITGYTREPGVRNLERTIGGIIRAKAVQFIDAQDAGESSRYSPEVHVGELETILGRARYNPDLAERENRPGVVNVLVAFSSGRGEMTGCGAIIFIEAAVMPGSGGLKLTGNLGQVIKESVDVALTWVKAHAYDLGLTHTRDEDLTHNKTIHVHCPAGGEPKDGPSAGVGFVVALISLFSGRPVPATLAMTGEVSLRGRVTAVGAIKEKLIGAQSAGITTALVPAKNQYEVSELPEEVKRGVKVVCVSDVWEVIRVVWPEWRMETAEDQKMIVSRL